MKSAINFRTTWIMLGSAAVLLAGLAIYVFIQGDTKPNTEGYLFESFHALGTKPADINGLEIEKGGEKIVLNRQPDGRWRITQPILGRADSGRVDELIRQFLLVRRDDKDTDLSDDLAKHGLDKPPVKLTLHRGERSSWLALGQTTVGGQQAVVYALSSDEPKTPHAVLKSRLKGYYKEKPPEFAGTAEQTLGLDDFRTTKLLGEGLALEAAPSQITSIKLTEKRADGVHVVKISRNNPGRAWQFELPTGFGDVEQNVPPELRNPSKIFDLASLLNSALSMEVPEVKDYLSEARDLKALGLDPNNEGVLRIDIERQDGVGPETLWIGAEAKKEMDKVYVRYEGDAAVAQVNGAKARMLRRYLDDPSTLRDRNLLKAKRDQIDALEITIGKATFELRKVGRGWKLKADGKVYEGDSAPIDELIYRLAEPRTARAFPPPDAKDDSLGLNPPSVQIDVWEDSVVAPAKDADPKAWPRLKEGAGPTARIQFGKREGDLAIVRRYLGLQKVDMKIPATTLELASRGRLDYTDAAIASFDPQNVEKIRFTKDGEAWEIERVPGERIEWKVLAPPAKKDQIGNNHQIALILDSFRALRPERVVAENATAEQLAAFGLDPAKPVWQFAFKLKDDPKERIYWFGNPVSGKPSVYTRTSSSDYLFESPSARMELVTKAKLTDLLPYRIEPSDVKLMKLRGWADAKGEPRVLEFERKPGGVWLPKGKDPVDERKLEFFLQQIVRPLAIEQVVDKGGPKPEHGLDIKSGALEVSLDVGKDKPITLTLGGMVNKQNKLIYVETNQAPGEVFTLDGERLVPVKEKSGSLSKE